MAVEIGELPMPRMWWTPHFSESKGLMVCDYCESSFEVAQIEGPHHCCQAV